MFRVCRHEQRVSRSEFDALIAAQKYAATCMHNVDLVLIMRLLTVGTNRPVVSKFHGPVLEQYAVQTVVRLSDGGKCTFRCHAFDHGY